MTNAEAFAINTLCRHLLGRGDYGPQPVTVPDDEVKEALAYLAERANKHLMAGFHRGSVERLWPTRPGRTP